MHPDPDTYCATASSLFDIMGPLFPIIHAGHKTFPADLLKGQPDLRALELLCYFLQVSLWLEHKPHLKPSC